jgi:hypothetical protein
MIVTSPFTVNVAKLGTTDDFYEQLVNGLNNTPYNQNNGFGFSIDTIEQDYISAYLILSNPIVVQRFDQDQQEVVETEVNREKLVPFRVDFDIGLLEVFSSQSDTTPVISRISELIEWSTSITESGLEVNGLYASLQESDLDIEIRSMHISDFEYDTVRGNYHLKSFNEREAEQLISEYRGNISYLCIVAENHSDTATFGFYRSGSIRLYSNTDGDDEFWNEMKHSISGNMGDI